MSNRIDWKELGEVAKKIAAGECICAMDVSEYCPVHGHHSHVYAERLKGKAIPVKDLWKLKGTWERDDVTPRWAMLAEHKDHRIDSEGFWWRRIPR